ncbi:hypothetical protein ACEWY4_017302 [Coilia grayii]|uniref:Immunoglobulin V-set domain-containing protein n=1 Tax=Coilia grayii TaxID=363190 RepID=A0ABD1JGF5_9TELE
MTDDQKGYRLQQIGDFMTDDQKGYRLQQIGDFTTDDQKATGYSRLKLLKKRRKTEGKMLGGVKAEPISVTATEGDNADIHCSAALAHGNDKYFCKDPCEDDHHVLVATKKHSQPPGKYSLVDHGSGSFTVTIYNVEFKDSGIYYCGVDRLYA